MATISEEHEIAERCKERLAVIYRREGWGRPPKVSPGMVRIILEEAERIERKLSEGVG